MIAVNIQFTTEYQVRVAAAAEDREMSVEEFIFDAVERALRRIENRRIGTARDVVELEALWQSAGESGESEPRGRRSLEEPS